MTSISRRGFLAGAAAAAGVAVLPKQPVWAAAKTGATAAKIKSGADLVTLAASGVRTSVLGIGTGTRGGREQRELGTAGFTKLVRHALDRGIRYIDTADSYMMHVYVRMALKDVKPEVRDEIFIQTKTRAVNPEVAKADIERYRREMNVGRIGSLLMHCMRRGDWPRDMRSVMDVLYEEKAKDRVHAVGVSCHGWDPLVASTDCDWIDTHLVRINPFGAKMDEEPARVEREMKKMCGRGRGMLGMKIFGENGYDSPEKRMQSLKYVLGLGCVHAFTIGFASPQQIDETMDMIQKVLA